jgi:hypothetical protein
VIFLKFDQLMVQFDKITSVSKNTKGMTISTVDGKSLSVVSITLEQFLEKLRAKCRETIFNQNLVVMEIQ